MPEVEDIYMAAALNSLGQIYAGQRRYREAEALLNVSVS
jgi:hypothetical protein